MNKFISRILSVVLAFSLVFTLSFKVSAAADFYTINVLDYSTLDDSGSNVITISGGSKTFSYAMPFNSRIYNSDLLLKVSGNDDVISSLTIKDEDNNSFTPTIVYIGNGYYRILFSASGYVIEELEFTINITSTSSSTMQVLGFHVSPMQVLNFSPKFDATVGYSEDSELSYKTYSNVNTFSTINEADTLYGSGGYYVTIDLEEWYKYDYLDAFFSISAPNVMSVECYIFPNTSNSQRVSVPFTVQELYSNYSTSDDYITSNFSVNIDLTGTERVKNSLLVLTIRGVISPEYQMAYPFDISCNSFTAYIRSDSFSNPVIFWFNEVISRVTELQRYLGLQLNQLRLSLDTSFTNLTSTLNTVGSNITSKLDTVSSNIRSKLDTVSSNITTKLESVKTSINDKLGDVQTNLQSTINSFKSKVTSLFDQWFTDLFEILNPEGSEEPAEDMTDKVQDQTGDLEDINNDMNDVSKPSADSIDMDLDSFVSGANLTLSTSGLSTILGNEVILQFLLMTITFAIVGYILYGKR